MMKQLVKVQNNRVRYIMDNPIEMIQIIKIYESIT